MHWTRFGAACHEKFQSTHVYLFPKRYLQSMNVDIFNREDPRYHEKGAKILLDFFFKSARRSRVRRRPEATLALTRQRLTIARET